MSKYTTELRWILEQALINKVGTPNFPVEDVKYLSVMNESLWPHVYGSLGLGNMVVFDGDSKFDVEHFVQTKKEYLCNMIIRRFFYREIGFETVGMWRIYMEEKCREIMPYYNELLKMKSEVSNPLDEIDMRFTSDSTSDGTSSTTSDTTSDSDSIFNNTPMSQIEGGLDTIKTGKYATTVDYGTSSANSQGSSTAHSTFDGDSTEKGRRHSLMYLMKSYQEEQMNVYVRIVDEFQDLFMGVW